MYNKYNTFIFAAKLKLFRGKLGIPLQFHLALTMYVCIYVYRMR